ncbi:MAG: HEAT repeat domain-containing protein, partial [Gemmatimonadetes bacterium]|nr:HEAT repeat domain-containing protein [Gemmatimonadota bacterium]
KRISAATRAIVDEELGSEDLNEIPKILRALQAAATNIKLYPLDAEPVSQSIAKLYQSLQGILTNHRAVTLASADQALLVNGTRVDTSAYAAIAEGFSSFADSAGLDSISFLSHVTADELETFIGALRDLPTHPDNEFWDDFHRQHGLAGIAFNQRKYLLGVVQSLLGTVEGELDDDLPDVTEEWTTRIDGDAEDGLRATLPRFGKELLVRGEHQLVRRLLHRLFSDFASQDALTREETVESCHRLLGGLIIGLQHRFTELAVDYLLAAFTEETEPRVAQELANVLYDMVGSAIQFADYQVAGRMLLEIKARREVLHQSKDEDSRRLAKMLSRRLDVTSKTLIEADLQSGDPGRQERAAQVVGSLGAPGIPLLIGVIKQERDFRARQTAASLLAEMGPEAGREMKRAVATEVLVEQRFRALEVIDTVTRDLRDELEYSLGDHNPKIRRAAFQLFERLHQDDLIDVVLPYARKDDHAVAKGAIRSLAALKSERAAKAVASVLDETKDDETAMACCQALGQIGDPAGIASLAKALKRKEFFGVGRQREEQVRATAAIALRQVDHPRAGKVLSRYVRDPDRRVKQLARSAAGKEG